MGDVIVLTKRVYKQGDFVEYLGTDIQNASSRVALVITYEKESGVLEITPLGSHLRHQVSENLCWHIRASLITGGLVHFIAHHPLHGECMVFAEVLINGVLHVYVKTRTSNQSVPIPITDLTFLYSAVPGP